MRYFGSPVRSRPLEVNPIVAQLVEQYKLIAIRILHVALKK
jgi:hypothetical protein